MKFYMYGFLLIGFVLIGFSMITGGSSGNPGVVGPAHVERMTQDKGLDIQAIAAVSGIATSAIQMLIWSWIGIRKLLRSRS